MLNHKYGKKIEVPQRIVVKVLRNLPIQIHIRHGRGRTHIFIS